MESKNNAYELLYMIHAQDEWALRHLLYLYKPKVDTVLRTVLRSFSFYAQYTEDLRQEAMILLMQSVDMYRESTGPYEGFAMVIAKRRILQEIRNLSRKCRNTQGTWSFDQVISEKEPAYDLYATPDGMVYPEYYLHYMCAKENLETALATLSEEDKAAIPLLQEGVSRLEGARHMGIGVQEYDLHLIHIRKAMHSILSEHDRRRTILKNR